MLNLLRKFLEFLLALLKGKEQAAATKIVDDGIAHNQQTQDQLKRQTADGQVDQLNKQFGWNETK